MKELESEEFYEDVLYILISELDKNKIASEVKIADVTKSIKVELFDIIEYEQYFNKIAKELEKKDKPNNISKSIDAEENIKQDKQSSFLRVESDRVDEMMNQVGELVINKSSYQQYENEFSNYEKLLEESINDIKKYYKDSVVKILRRFEDSMSKKEFKETRNEYLESFNTKIKYMTDMGTEFKQSLDKFRDSYLILTRVTNDLQSTVMKIRMVPIAQTFNRFRRLVRDLSRELEKDVVLEVLGEDTELDKSVIEVLVDPLVHLIRNALGHGIESPDEREKLGKPRTGTIRLSASHEGNLIIIKVSDDGYGMNPNVIFESAVKKGVVDKDAKLTDIEKIDLIYLTDFTTTTKVSSLSGRGVGMDVVKKSLEKINGRITIETVVGEGTSFSLKIPLTLAIIQALIVESEKEYYSIPINSIVETIKIDKDEIKMLENVFVINVRDELVNVLSIKNLFNLPSQYEDIESYYAVILMVEDKKIALLVNNLIGEQDIVIKALKDKITKSQGIAGATILGDGRVSFILDIQTIIDLGNKRILEHISASHHDKASIDKINLKSFIESIKENNLESKVENEEDNTKL
jgi:two-component system chemotaxis sensor kinase CheA